MRAVCNVVEAVPRPQHFQLLLLLNVTPHLFQRVRREQAIRAVFQVARPIFLNLSFNAHADTRATSGLAIPAPKNLMKALLFMTGAIV